MNSPFQYGKLATGSSFINRQAEKLQLKSNLISGINTVVISPGRWGKSSFVRESLAELEKETRELRVCQINLFAIRTDTEFYQLFTKELFKSFFTTQESLKAIIKKLLHEVSPRITPGADTSNDFTISLESQNIKGYESYILDLPERLAHSTGQRIIVCLDEFQNLARLRDFTALAPKISNAWQKQQNVSYCIICSKNKIMTDLFTAPSNPFYRFAQILHLSKISENDWVQYIIDSFKRTGKSISRPIATLLVQRVNCHAWYVQQYAHFSWILTSNNVTESILSESFNQLTITNLALFKRECESMSPSQLGLLIAIASHEKAYTSISAMVKYGLGTPQNVTKNKELMQRKDLVEATPDGFTFLDPVFENWFISEYLN